MNIDDVVGISFQSQQNISPVSSPSRESLYVALVLLLLSSVGVNKGILLAI